MNNEAFLIYKSFYEPIKSLSDDQLGKLFREIFEWQINKIEKAIDPSINMAFQFFKNQFRVDLDKYEKNVLARNKINGMKGGRPKTINENPLGLEKPKKPSGLFKTQKTHNDNVNVNDNVNDIKEIDNTDVLSKEKIPPNIEDVKKYCEDRNNGVDAQAFWDHYNARGWKPKGYTQKMKSWKSAVHTWEKNNNGFTQIKKEDYKPVRFKQFEL